MYTPSKIKEQYEKYVEMKSGNEKLIFCRPSFLVNNSLHTFRHTWDKFLYVLEVQFSPLLLDPFSQFWYG